MQDSTRQKGVSTLLVVLILGTVLAVGPAPAAADRYNDLSEPSIVTTVQSQNTLSPGETTTMALTVQNRQNGNTGADRTIDGLSRVIQTFQLSLGSAGATTATVESGNAPIDIRSGQQSLGTIQAGTSNQATIALEVDENATPGTYRLPVQTTYTYVDQVIINEEDDYQVLRDTETVTNHVTVRIEESVRLDVLETTSEGLYKNGDGRVRVTIENGGTEVARNAELRMIGSNQFTTASNGVALGRLAPGETATATFQTGVNSIEEAGSYGIDLQLQYEDENDNPQQSAVRTGNIAVTDGPEFSLSASSSELYVDSTGVVELTVINTGDRQATDARARLHPTEPFALLSSSSSLGTLSPGESATARFKLEVPNRGLNGTYPLSVTIAHDDVYGNVVEHEPSSVDVAVGPERTFEVINTAQIATGSTQTIELTVKNTGTTPLDDSEVRINTNSPFETDDDTAYVGRLMPGETATVAFTVSVDSAATAKRYTLDTTIKHKNAFGEHVITDVETAPVRVTESSGNPLGIGLIGRAVLLLLPLVLILGVAFRTDLGDRLRG